MATINDVLAGEPECPAELAAAILEFWPDDQVLNAARIAKLESGFDAFALDDTAAEVGCGGSLGQVGGVRITGERSVGYFQINSCNFPDWEWQRFYNARHNAGTAHMLWEQAGGSWSPWFFSAKALGLS